MLRARIGNIMAGLVAAGITVIGARFLLAPRAAALAYGIPLASKRDRWLTAVKGARDVTSGLLLAAVLLSGDRAVARRALGIATLIPLGDGGIIASRYGWRRPGLLAMHWGTAAFMLTGAALLREHRAAPEPPIAEIAA
jgi:Domain of unknown function (DUF4267)